MLFHFLNFSQCVVCMFGHKKIYKVTNLKVHSKGRYFIFKNPFQELQRTARLDYKVVFLYLWYHKNKSCLWKFEWGERLVEHCMFSKSKPGAWFFISLYFWWKPTVFRKLWCHFHFILHICLIKQRLWAELGFVYSVTGETSSSPAPTAPPAGREIGPVYTWSLHAFSLIG